MMQWIVKTSRNQFLMAAVRTENGITSGFFFGGAAPVARVDSIEDGNGHDDYSIDDCLFMRVAQKFFVVDVCCIVVQQHAAKNGMSRRGRRKKNRFGNKATRLQASFFASPFGSDSRKCSASA